MRCCLIRRTCTAARLSPAARHGKATGKSGRAQLQPVAMSEPRRWSGASRHQRAACVLPPSAATRGRRLSPPISSWSRAYNRAGPAKRPTPSGLRGRQCPAQTQALDAVRCCRGRGRDESVVCPGRRNIAKVLAFSGPSAATGLRPRSWFPSSPLAPGVPCWRLYEHKVFVQALSGGSYSFDHGGWRLGKSGPRHPGPETGAARRLDSGADSPL